MSSVPNPKLELYLAHRNALVDYATSLVGCRAQAEDVVQETWLRERLPDCTLIGVSHQPAVQRLFGRSIDLQECAAACRRLELEPAPA